VDVAKSALEAGFSGLKLHEVDLEIVAQVCRDSGYPPSTITVDVNCAWSADDAINRVQTLSELQVGWIEEPIWPPDDYAALAELRRATATGPLVAAGENFRNRADAEWAMSLGAVDVAQPSVIKVGGVSSALQIMRSAERSGVAVTFHSFYHGPGLLATMHLACAAMRPAPLIEWLFGDPAAYPFGQALRPIDGVLHLPDGPGLGLAPDTAFLDEFAVEGRPT
jgi:L-alanine-DL-glutamate epimerase-like enolase superfamily enzyme